MSFIDKIECLLINLDRSPERLEQMQKRLDDLNIPFRRVAAVDGKKVIFTDREINAKEYERCHGKYITPTEVACYISHYNALQFFQNESSKELALILEDDMVFCEEFLEILDQLIARQDEWDFVKLNGASERVIPFVEKKLYEKYALISSFTHQSKSGAYLVNRKAARNYIDGLLPMRVPYDHEFTKFWKYHINMFSVIPFPTWEQQEESTIDYDMIHKNKKPWYKRLDTFVYRTQIALTRIWYGFKTKMTLK